MRACCARSSSTSSRLRTEPMPDIRTALTVEDDRFLRVLGIVLDPSTPLERRAAFADFFSNDEPDFEAYCARVRARVAGLFPCAVRLVKTQDAMREALP